MQKLLILFSFCITMQKVSVNEFVPRLINSESFFFREMVYSNQNRCHRPLNI